MNKKNQKTRNDNQENSAHAACALTRVVMLPLSKHFNHRYSTDSGSEQNRSDSAYKDHPDYDEGSSARLRPAAATCVPSKALKSRALDCFGDALDYIRL